MANNDPPIPDFSVYAHAPSGSAPAAAAAPAPDDAGIPDFSVYANGGDGTRTQAATGAPNPDAALQNNGNESYLSGALKGTATGVVQGGQDITSTSNLVGELGDWTGSHIESLLRGVPMEQVQKDRAARAAAVQGFLAPIDNAIAPIGNAITGVDKKMADNAQYVPSTEAGKIAQSGVRGATSAALLGGVNPASMSAGLVGGAAQQGATDASDNPYLGMAAGVLAPILTHNVAPALGIGAGSLLGPATKGAQEAQAAKMLGEAASDPQAAITAAQTGPQQIVPGSKPNLAEQTGDIGLAQATKAAGIANPDFAARQMASAGDQNAARAGALDALAPANADVSSPSATLNKQLSDIDAAHDATINSLSQRADALNSGIAGNFDPELVGSSLRNVIQQASDSAAKARSRLYDLVDPDNKLSVVTAPARQAAQDLAASIDPSVTIPSPNATPIIGMVANLSDVTPFNKLNALDTTITGAMAHAKQSGDYVGHDQLRTLKSAVMDSINNAVENQHAFEQTAVAKGTMDPADTIVARFSQDGEVPDFGNPGGNSAPGDIARAVGESAPRETPISGTGVAEGQSPGGLRASAGDQGIQSLLGPGRDNPASPTPSSSAIQGISTPNEGGVTGRMGQPGPLPASGSASGSIAATPTANFDADAAARLNKAKAAHADFAQTYREGPVKDVLSTNGFAKQYHNAASIIPENAFRGDNTGYTTARSFLKAANNSPEAVSAFQDMAMARLRSNMKGDVLDPKVLSAWKQKYAQALKAVDEVSPGFSSNFDDAAKATQALADAHVAKIQDLKSAQEGAAGMVMGANTPGEVKARVSDIIRAKNGPTQIKGLLNRMKDDPGAVQGLQRAGIEGILDSVSNAGTSGGEHIISGAKLRSLLSKNGDAVEALYGKEGLGNMRAVAADIERSQKALDNTRARSGSDTGANVFKKMQEVASKAGHISIGGAMSIAGIEALHSGNYMGAAGIAGLAGLRAGLGKLRANGISKVNDLYLKALEDPEVGKTMLQTYMDKQGQVRPSVLIRLGQVVQQSAKTLATPITPPEQREGRKEGGRVGMSHEFLVNRLIRMVELAKREQNETTKPLLNAPDPLVVHALKISQKAI